MDGSHNIKTLSQLKDKGFNTLCNKSHLDTIDKHLNQMKDTQQKCLRSIREMRTQFDNIFQEAERSVNSRFDEVVQNGSTILQSMGTAIFQ